MRDWDEKRVPVTLTYCRQLNYRASSWAVRPLLLPYPMATLVAIANSRRTQLQMRTLVEPAEIAPVPVVGAA